jgi:hypothetical protein
VIESLPSKYEALNSNPGTTKGNKKGKHNPYTTLPENGSRGISSQHIE